MDANQQKDTRGRYLIQKLCKPNKKGQYDNDPELMAELFDYCAQDVRTEMALGSVLKPLTATEQDIWVLTQRINLRGVPVDPVELQNAVTAVIKTQTKINDECIKMTGCKPSERARLLDWVNYRLIPKMPDMRSNTVSAYLSKDKLKEALE
jgi:DNA polymerase